VRKAAAGKIAGIAATHPSQLPAVLDQVAVHLGHQDWDARLAAGHCLGLLARHFVHRTPADLAAAARSSPFDSAPAAATAPPKDDPGGGQLLLASFDVARVLEQGKPLLASGGEVREHG
jgi:hypothetical protein